MIGFMTGNIYLIGASGHARVVADVVTSMQLSVIAFVDKVDSDQMYMGIQVMHEKDFSGDGEVLIAIGSNQIRKQLSVKKKWNYFTAIHTSAIVSQYAQIDKGSVVMHGAIIQTMTNVGQHVIVNTGAQIDHDCKIGSYAHIAPGAVLCGQVTVGEGAFVGAGAVVIPGIEIGNWAQIGAGAVVINNVPDGATVVGNPARIIKSKIL